MDLSIIAALMGVGEYERAQVAAWDQHAVMPGEPMIRKQR